MQRMLIVAIMLAASMPFAGPAVAQELPTIPDAVPVTLDRSTTALVVADITNFICGPNPACVAMLPGVTAFLGRARTEGIFVVHTSVPLPGLASLPPVAPVEGEPVVSSLADKFSNTNLDDLLRERGITTVIIVGVSSNGAVLYTSYGAAARGYTVVVPEDAMAGTTPFDTFLARYQLLNQPGANNPKNQSLAMSAVAPDFGAVTLTQLGLITFS